MTCEYADIYDRMEVQGSNKLKLFLYCNVFDYIISYMSIVAALLIMLLFWSVRRKRKGDLNYGYFNIQ